MNLGDHRNAAAEGEDEQRRPVRLVRPNTSAYRQRLTEQRNRHVYVMEPRRDGFSLPLKADLLAGGVCFPYQAIGPAQADLLGWYDWCPRQVAREIPAWPNIEDGVMRLSAAELSALLISLIGGVCPRATEDCHPDEAGWLPDTLRRSQSGHRARGQRARTYPDWPMSDNLPDESPNAEGDAAARNCAAWAGSRSHSTPYHRQIGEAAGCPSCPPPQPRQSREAIWGIRPLRRLLHSRRSTLPACTDSVAA